MGDLLFLLMRTGIKNKMKKRVQRKEVTFLHFIGLNLKVL